MELDLFADPPSAQRRPTPHPQPPQGLPLYIGTSSWSFDDWRGSLYPADAKPADYLTYYAQHFPVVEIDTTFYRIPTPSMVDAWYRRTPDGFRFAAKIPQVITHDKVLRDCQAELQQFTEAMSRLREKLGPLLFQFPYFSKRHFATPQAFIDRLVPVLEQLPAGLRFAVEIRNRWWLTRRFFDLLRAHRVAFALIDHPWMPPVQELVRQHDVITADFSYIRWLGDRRAMEAVTQRWDRLVADRQQETTAWVGVIRQFLARQVAVYGFYNNHYAGHSPGSIALFYDIWQRQLSTSP
ncbi:MAG TPA: DUF72 domain-containing protein [Alphaproteobacteria bacterium]|nr:DUF72 domain-containing protein [Alphaproteobacteria bacterium]